MPDTSTIVDVCFAPLSVAISSACLENVIGGAMFPLSKIFVDDTVSTMISSSDNVEFIDSDMVCQYYGTNRVNDSEVSVP